MKGMLMFIALLSLLALQPFNQAHGTEAATQVEFQGLPVNTTPEERDEFLDRYTQLVPPKALAMALTKEGDWAIGWTGSAAGVLPAIGGAIAGCEQSRQKKGIEAPCDLLRVNDEELELGLALRRRHKVDDVDAPTLLWRYENRTTTVYIGGTLHGFKASLYPLPPAFEHAFDAADELVLEVNLANLTQQKIFDLQQKYAVLPDGQTLEDVIPGTALVALRNFSADMGLPWQAINRLTPAAIAQELGMAIFMTQGLMPNYGFEQHYMARAMQAKKTIGELETIEYQLEILSRMPIDLQAEESIFVLEEMKSAIVELLDAWYTADPEVLWHLITQEGEKSEELNAFYQEVFNKRNRGMAKKIESLLKQRKRTYLVLVGAGHLAGDDSIINLLDKRGFKGVQLMRSGEVVAD